MAKRRRLEVPQGLETKTMTAPPPRPPVAAIAGDAAGRAAEAEMAAALEAAEAEGRIIRDLPVARIEMHHIARDRMVLDPDEMTALSASIEARGQQTPIEVVHLGGERYGLISGLRRIEALKRLGRDRVLALVRAPESAEAAYRAMIEENEIRADLSFWERANIAVMATGQGVYASPRAAVKDLFAHVPAPRRSKILTFVTLREKLGQNLAFPTAIPEKLGLALAKAIEADGRVARRITDALRKTPPADAVAERRVLERALSSPGPSRPEAERIAPELTLEAKDGRAVLKGRAVDADFLDALRAFAVSHAKA